MTTVNQPDQGTSSAPQPQAAQGYPAPAPQVSGGYMPMAVKGVPALPTGVTLAPVGRRIGAYFLAVVLFIVTLGIGYLIWGLVLWGRGTSPAFSVLKMRCVKADTGAKATWGTMALRNIVGDIVQNIGPMGIVSLILFLVREDHRSIMDLVGGTIVVHDPQGILDVV